MNTEQYKVIIDLDDNHAGEIFVDMEFDGNNCTQSNIRTDSDYLQQLIKEHDLEEGIIFAMVEGASRHEKWLLIEYHDEPGYSGCKTWTHKDHHNFTPDGKQDEDNTFKVLHEMEWTAHELDLAPTSRTGLR